MVKGLFLFMAPAILFATTYKIVEPDVMSEVESRKDRVVAAVKKQGKEAIEHVRKLSGEQLDKAPKSYSYYVDPTYTLTQDIPRVDSAGNVIGVLYPKGYTFNPLDYLHIAPPPIVAFNACNREESELAKKLVKNFPDAMFASSGCEIDSIPNSFDRRLFLVTKEMKQKFDLKYTLSVVTADLKAKRIRIDVYKTTH